MRILSETEERILWDEVITIWKWSGCYFYPLHPSSRTDLLAFPSDELEAVLSSEDISSALKNIGCKEIMWWRESDPSERTSLREFDDFYGWSESFIVDPEKDWIVYWSHENTITFGGEKLVTKIQRILPAWREYEW